MNPLCKRALKKILCSALILTLLLSLFIPAYAKSAVTTLRTTVPSQFDMSLTIEGKGSVKLNRKLYKKSTTVKIDRNTQEEITIKPNLLYKVKSVSYNGEDITAQLKNGVYTTPYIVGNARMSVCFIKSGGSWQDSWQQIQDQIKDWFDNLFKPHG